LARRRLHAHNHTTASLEVPVADRVPIDVFVEMYYTYHMIRIQLHIDERQDRLLRTLARETGSTRAELIRRGIDLLLRSGTEEDDPLMDLVGAAGPAGRTDASERHDDLLYAAERPSRSYGDDR